MGWRVRGTWGEGREGKGSEEKQKDGGKKQWFKRLADPSPAAEE